MCGVGLVRFGWIEKLEIGFFKVIRNISRQVGPLSADKPIGPLVVAISGGTAGVLGLSAAPSKSKQSRITIRAKAGSWLQWTWSVPALSQELYWTLIRCRSAAAQSKTCAPIKGKPGNTPRQLEPSPLIIPGQSYHHHQLARSKPLPTTFELPSPQVSISSPSRLHTPLRVIFS